jgi:hypothetical protein
MIRFGLRLTLAGGRESAVRLVITAVAVALGVGMLLLTIAGTNAVGAQNDRGAWLESALQPAAVRPTAASVWFALSSERYGNGAVERVDVAAAGAHAPVPPGIPELPAPGQFYASPALSALLRTVPADQLASRFPGRQVGVIGPSALPSPDDLIIVEGDTPSALAHAAGAADITSYATTAANGGLDVLDSTEVRIVLAILSLVLLFPVLVFVGAATRLSAARREQRFAAMRLVGATPPQITIISSVEASVAAVAGVALGFCLYFGARPALAHIPFTGQPFAVGDLSLSAAQAITVALGVPLAAVVVARVASRRVRISPLGVTRRVTPKPPRALRLLPLLAGVGELSYYVVAGRPASTGGQLQAYFLGFLLTMVGLVVAGPWLTMIGAKAAAARTRKATVLLAARRLADTPRAAFRAVSGLVLALFVTSVVMGTLASLVADHGSSGTGSAASGTVIDRLGQTTQAGDVAAVAPSLLSSLRAIPGVKGLSVVHAAPAAMTTSGTVQHINGLSGDQEVGVVSCAQLATTPALGRCAAGATTAAIEGVGYMSPTKALSIAAATVWPTATFVGPAPSAVEDVAVATDGDPAVIARVETVFDRALPFASSVSPFGALDLQSAEILDSLQTASGVAIVASLLIAGCSLAVCTAAGVADRKRSFSLLRVTGVTVGALRAVVAWESAVPLVLIVLGSAAVGLGAADLFLRSQLGISLAAPGAGYYGLVAGGVAASLAVIAVTLPLMERMTRPDAVRVE